MSIYPMQDNFNRGEISPRLHGRPTLELFRSAAAEMVNFEPLPQGGFCKRLGTLHRTTALATADTYRMFAFSPDADSRFIVEMSDSELRVWTTDTNSIVNLGGGNTTAAHTFTDIRKIKTVQSNDVIYFFGGGAQHTLSRFGVNDWRLEAYDFEDGPFDSQNLDKTGTIQASGTSGNITLTAAGSLTFTADLVGSIIRLEEDDLSDIGRWSPTTGYNVGDLVRAADNVYRVSVAGTGGGTAEAVIPSHTSGEYRYGDAGVATFEYLHSEYALVKVTGFTNATTVTAEVLSARPYEDKPAPYVPDSIVAAGTYRWSLSMFYGTQKPVACAFYQERLALAYGQKVFLSRTRNFRSFREGTNPDDAVSVEIAADQYSGALSLSEVNGYLMGVTSGGIIRLSSASGGPLQPGDVFQRRVKREPMSDLQPLETDDSIFAFPDPELTIYELAFSEEAGGFLSPNAAISSEHILKRGGGVMDSAMARSDVQAAKFVMASGQIANLIFDKFQSVNGWCRHDYTGKVMASAVVRDEYGYAEWMIVERDGVVNVEVRKSFRDYGAYDVNELGYMGGQPVNLPDLLNLVPVFSDSTIAYMPGSGALTHLEGKEVVYYSQLGGGTAVVAGGNIAGPTGQCYVGLPIVSRFKSLRAELGRRGDGADANREQRVSRLILDVLNSSGLEHVETDHREYLLGEEDRDFEGPPELKTGFYETPVFSSHADEGQFILEHTKPLPCYIRSVTPVLEG